MNSKYFTPEKTKFGFRFANFVRHSRVVISVMRTSKYTFERIFRISFALIVIATFFWFRWPSSLGTVTISTDCFSLDAPRRWKSIIFSPPKLSETSPVEGAA